MTTSVSSFPVVSKKGSSRSIKREGKIPGQKKTRGSPAFRLSSPFSFMPVHEDFNNEPS